MPISKEKVRVFDFFSGCGGTAEGFRQAGCSVEFALDFDRDAADTFQLNFPEAVVLTEDIQKVAADSIGELISKRTGPLLFSGCAPCQPFSRQNSAARSGARDVRKSLLLEFGRFVEHWKPEYVFVENVPGLQRFDDQDGPLPTFLSMLERLGYCTEARVVAASAYGVPQTRERLIILASRVGPIAIPAFSHGTGAKPISTVRDWLSDLPAIRAGQTHPDDSDHVAARLSPLNKARIYKTPEGGGRASWPKSLQLACHKDHVGHSDVYGRLAWDKPASGLTTRCISYSNGRFGHPEQHRALSVREAACLQTFPRTYRFKGSLESRARQIGNAVPPLMAEAVGVLVAKHATKSR